MIDSVEYKVGERVLGLYDLIHYGLSMDGGGMSGKREQDAMAIVGMSLLQCSTCDFDNATIEDMIDILSPTILTFLAILAARGVELDSLLTNMEGVMSDGIQHMIKARE